MAAHSWILPPILRADVHTMARSVAAGEGLLDPRGSGGDKGGIFGNDAAAESWGLLGGCGGHLLPGVDGWALGLRLPHCFWGHWES